jgi:hypothetical protein
VIRCEWGLSVGIAADSRAACAMRGAPAVWGGEGWGGGGRVRRQQRATAARHSHKKNLIISPVL